jgi:hypothetical protein
MSTLYVNSIGEKTSGNKITLNNTLKVDSIEPKTTGSAVLMPNKPAFLAHRLASGTQSLSAQTQTLVQFNETDYNVGSHYNTSTYTFTCPVTGLYQFNHWCYVYNTTQTNTRLFINGVSKYRFSSVQTDTTNNPHGAGCGISLLLNANDTVKLYVWANENSNVYPGADPERSSFFSGYLIG